VVATVAGGEEEGALQAVGVGVGYVSLAHRGWAVEGEVRRMPVRMKLARVWRSSMALLGICCGLSRLRCRTLEDKVKKGRRFKGRLVDT
jgi:hypothetical protein